MDTDFDIKSYRERWKAVEEFERKELRSLTMEMKLQQMITIWRMARDLAFPLSLMTVKWKSLHAGRS